MRKDDVVNTDKISVWSSISDEPGYMLHCHAEYEVYYFVRGDVEYRIEGHPYIMENGSILLIPPRSIHGFTVKTNAAYERISIHFLPGLLENMEQTLLLNTFRFPGSYYPPGALSQADLFVRSVGDCRNMEEPLRTIALKHRLIALLTHIRQIETTGRDAFPKNERIQEICFYLDSNLQETFSLDQLSRKFKISKNYLNVLFRREMGTTINQYVRIKRLVWARQELQQGTNAEDAAYRVGFNDYSNFYKAYRAFFGVKPSAGIEPIPPDIIQDNLPYL